MSTSSKRFNRIIHSSNRRRRAGGDPAFKISINTENAGSVTKTFVLPAVGGPFDVTDWGDGQSDLAVSGPQTHLYGATGIYTITINKITNAFQPCKFNNGGDKAKILDILSWGHINWDACNSAFYGCTNLIISATDFPDVSNVTNFTGAWRNCTSLTSFPLIDFSSGTNFYTTWYGCTGLTSFPKIDTSSATSLYYAWYGCTSLTSFELIDVSSVVNMFGAWYNCSGLISFPRIIPSICTIFTSSWNGCTGLTSFPLIDVSAGTIFKSTWKGCTGLTTFPELVPSSGLNFNGAWYGCTGLTSFPVIDVGAGTNFTDAWRLCTGLTGFPSGLDLSSATTLFTAWYGCTGLTSFPLLDVSNVTIFTFSWYGCTGLTSFPLLVTSAGTDFKYTWQNCTGLNGYAFPTVNMHSMTNGTNCFNGVTLSTTSYSNLLIDIEANNQNNTVIFHGGSSKYSAGAAATAHADLIADHSWTISDGGLA